MESQLTTVVSQFSRDILAGLSHPSPYIPSKYFYDKEGSRLFQDIMALPEYYLTRCEYDILNQEKEALANIFSPSGEAFELIELGSGNGLKTRILLDHFVEKGLDFVYKFIDISLEEIESLSENLRQSMPGLRFEGVHDFYQSGLQKISQNSSSKTKKVLLFLGSNIGNFPSPEDLEFIQSLRRHLQKGDLLLLGADLKKHTEIILNAYNDSSGVTKAFNINLLHRINRELDANINLEAWDHSPNYDPESGMCRSYLLSKWDQEFYIPGHGKSYSFKQGEMIHTETSRKYTLNGIEKLANQAQFTVIRHFKDQKDYFVDSLWEAVESDNKEANPSESYYQKDSLDVDTWNEVTQIDYEKIVENYPFDNLFHSFKKKELNLLDIGCGTAIFSSILDKDITGNIQCSVDLLDISEYSLQEARKTYDLQNHFYTRNSYLSDINDIQGALVGPDRYDLIWSIHSFYTIDKARLSDTLSHAIKMLKPNGKFVICLARESSYYELCSYYMENYPNPNTNSMILNSMDLQQCLDEKGIKYETVQMQFFHTLDAQNENTTRVYLNQCVMDNTVDSLNFFKPVLEKHFDEKENQYLFEQVVDLVLITKPE